MEERPAIKIGLTRIDKVLEWTGLCMLLLLWSLAIYDLFVLPDTVPVHFNFSGEPDSYGTKATILILPITGLFIYILLSRLSKYPRIYNYPVKITAANAATEYRNATRFIRYLKAVILLIFIGIDVFTYLTATGKSNGLSWWFLPAMLMLLLVPISYWVVKSIKKAK